MSGNNTMSDDTVSVVVSSLSGTRGETIRQLNVDILSDNLRRFVNTIGGMLAQMPRSMGEYTIDEIEISAEVTGNGSIALFGTGGEVGASGGLKLTFRRNTKQTS